MNFLKAGRGFHICVVLWTSFTYQFSIDHLCSPRNFFCKVWRILYIKICKQTVFTDLCYLTFIQEIDEKKSFYCIPFAPRIKHGKKIPVFVFGEVTLVIVTVKVITIGLTFQEDYYSNK